MEMNETSATSASGMSLLPDGIATLTTVHFALIAVLAVLVVIGLLWGIKAKRSRVRASRDVIAHAEEAGVPPAPIEPDTPREAAPVEQPMAEQSQTQTRTMAPVPAAPPSIEQTTQDTTPTPISPVPVVDEPVASVPSVDAHPAAEPTVQVPTETSQTPVPIEAAVPAPSHADGPVTLLKGLGPKVATQLGALGVTTVGQMAALSDGEAQSIDAQLGNFTGRMGRDRWVEQARLLAAGDKAGFEAVFGKL